MFTVWPALQPRLAGGSRIENPPDLSVGGDEVEIVPDLNGGDGSGLFFTAPTTGRRQQPGSLWTPASASEAAHDAVDKPDHRRDSVLLCHGAPSECQIDAGPVSPIAISAEGTAAEIVQTRIESKAQFVDEALGHGDRMDQRWVLVFNAVSGGADDDVFADVRRALEPVGRLEIVAPEDPDSFDAEVRRAARGAAVIVSAGGDGTLNYTLNALRDSLTDVTLALVPMGTGNDLARTLGLPQDPVAAARALLDGSTRTLDVARASGPGVDRLFINACMGGFPVEANEVIDENTKKRLGPLAFWIGGAKALTALTKSSVTINGIAVQDCIAAGVGNGHTCGGGMEVWPSADPGDGLLDGAALAAASVPQALALAAKIKAATHEELDSVKTTSAPKIAIEAEPEIQFNVDGELVGLRSPAIFEIVSSVKFLVP
jgi:diacylglycerol kinase (ATP)